MSTNLRKVRTPLVPGALKLDDTPSNFANESYRESNGVWNRRSAMCSVEQYEDQDTPIMLDAVGGPEDLAKSLPGQNELEMLRNEEQLNLLDKNADPEGEKLSKQEWRKFTQAERVGICRLRHRCSHATRPQMTRMLLRW